MKQIIAILLLLSSPIKADSPVACGAAAFGIATTLTVASKNFIRDPWMRRIFAAAVTTVVTQSILFSQRGSNAESDAAFLGVGMAYGLSIPLDL